MQNKEKIILSIEPRVTGNFRGYKQENILANGNTRIGEVTTFRCEEMTQIDVDLFEKYKKSCFATVLKTKAKSIAKDNNIPCVWQDLSNAKEVNQIEKAGFHKVGEYEPRRRVTNGIFVPNGIAQRVSDHQVIIAEK